ncbi:MAG: glycerophosphodiester phosphodiesterase family protein [Gammaproteobacteria bacterium]|nr:glycerophosphodiester phosphodiesterase family protein [Gammaproteobacteria bacterium]
MKQSTSNFKVIGHRGAAALDPENTLRSFARAVREGVDGIEFDVQYIDGRALVLHDDTLNRTSNGSGPANSFTFEKLREFDFGLGERIPTLAEAVDSIPSNILVNVELKSENSALASYEVLCDFSSHRFLVSSFRVSELEAFARVAQGQENLRLAVLHLGLDDAVLHNAKSLGASAICLCDPFVRGETVNAVRDSGYELYVFTVNSLNRARQLMGLGASGVITDNPNKINSDSL